MLSNFPPSCNIPHWQCNYLPLLMPMSYQGNLCMIMLLQERIGWQDMENMTQSHIGQLNTQLLKLN
jgi:hypothetical protein